MKFLKLSIMAALVACSANAGLITTGQSFFDKEIKTSKKSLDTYGLNPRVYVFTVGREDGAVAPMQCITVYTEQNVGEGKKGGKSTAPVMQCVKI